jgi:hypothetical protein
MLPLTPVITARQMGQKIFNLIQFSNYFPVLTKDLNYFRI